MIPFLAAILTLPAQSSVTFKYQPPVGAIYKYRTVLDSKQNMGRGMDMSSKTQMDAQSKVLSRKGNLTTLETKTLKVKVTAPKGSPMAAQTAQMEKTLMGNTTVSTIDIHFKPVKGTSTAMNQMTQGMMGGMNNYSFPTKPVRVGESWTTNMDLGKMMGSISSGMKVKGKIPIVCRLQRIQGKDAIVAITMKGSMEMEMSGQAMKMDFDSKGTMRLTIATGMSLYSDMVSSYTVNVSGQKMKTSMVQTMRPL